MSHDQGFKVEWFITIYYHTLWYLGFVNASTCHFTINYHYMPPIFVGFIKNFSTIIADDRSLLVKNNIQTGPTVL